jgi:hypothetical protein
MAGQSAGIMAELTDVIPVIIRRGNPNKYEGIQILNALDVGSESIMLRFDIFRVVRRVDNYQVSKL